MKRLHRKDEEVYRRIVNKMLEHVGKTYDDVKQLDEAVTNGTLWCNYYKFETQQQYDDWKQWTLNFLRTDVYPKYTKRDSEYVFSSIDLMWGLTVRKDEE